MFPWPFHLAHLSVFSLPCRLHPCCFYSWDVHHLLHFLLQSLLDVDTRLHYDEEKKYEKFFPDECAIGFYFHQQDCYQELVMSMEQDRSAM